MFTEKFEYDLQIEPEVVRDFLMDTEKFREIVPQFKEITQINDNTFKVKLYWVFTLEFEVKREIAGGPNATIITYFMDHPHWPHVRSNIQYNIRNEFGRTHLTVIFTYDGPFEGRAKSLAKEVDKRMRTELNNIIKEWRSKEKTTAIVQARKESLGDHTIDILNMKTMLAKKIKKEELERTMEEALAMSVDKPLVVLLSDGVATVRLDLSNGEVVHAEGNMAELKNEELKII